jgi:protease IV
MTKGRYLFILFSIFLILIVATILSFFFLEIGRPPSISAPSYLEIRLEGPIEEYPETNFWRSLVLGGRPLSVYDIWMSLRKARVDNRISGVLLRLGPLAGDWAKCSEIRDAVIDFRKSGKKAFAYIEEGPEFDKEYYLATGCDKIILHPLGWLGITGIGGTVPFFKKALDRLGVEAEIEHVEEYKTAYNMFTESGFTSAHREMTESIAKDLFDRYLRSVAESRKKSEAEVRALIDEAFFQGARAIQAGVVDELLFDDQLAALFSGEGRRPRRVGLGEYVKINPASLGLDAGPKVALIYEIGPIHGGESLGQSIGSETIARWIREAREDKSIAAVVFRIDSPGGSAVASDAIWREVMLCRKEKPVVVSMSDVAGSGGYWIAMAAHKIIAQPQTLTGSIGVLSGKFNLEKLLAKIGVTSETVRFGPKSDIFSPFRPWTAEERRLMKKQILWIYDQFLTKVAEGRKKTKEEIDKIGKGRVWTGSQAQSIGLVDDLGGLSKAIDAAKDLAGIAKEENVRLEIWPKSRGSFLRRLFGFGDAPAGFAPVKELRDAFAWADRLNENRIWAFMPLIPNF